MTCPVCFSLAYSGASLSNGEVVHTSCLQKLTNAVTAADRTLSAERTHVVYLRAQLASQDTYLGSVIRFFGRGVDSEILKSRIRAAEESLLISLNGHWHLRHAERNFALMHMKAVKYAKG